MLAYSCLTVDKIEELAEGGKLVTLSHTWKSKTSDAPIEIAFRNTKHVPWIKDIKIGMTFDMTLTPDLDTP